MRTVRMCIAYCSRPYLALAVHGGLQQRCMKCRNRRPLLVVPSGKTAMQPPCFNTADISMADARSIMAFTAINNRVPLLLASQRQMGQERTSIFDTKRTGRTAFNSKYPAMKMWLATSIMFCTDKSGAAPQMRSLTFRIPIKLLCQRRSMLVRVLTGSHG